MPGDGLARLYVYVMHAKARTQVQAELAAKSVQAAAPSSGDADDETAWPGSVGRLAAAALADNRRNNVHVAWDQKNLAQKSLLRSIIRSRPSRQSEGFASIPGERGRVRPLPSCCYFLLKRTRLRAPSSSPRASMQCVEQEMHGSYARTSMESLSSSSFSLAWASCGTRASRSRWMLA